MAEAVRREEGSKAAAAGRGQGAGGGVKARRAMARWRRQAGKLPCWQAVTPCRGLMLLLLFAQAAGVLCCWYKDGKRAEGGDAAWVDRLTMTPPGPAGGVHVCSFFSMRPVIGQLGVERGDWVPLGCW